MREHKKLQKQIDNKNIQLTDCTFNPQINKSKFVNNSNYEDESLIERFNKVIKKLL